MFLNIRRVLFLSCILAMLPAFSQVRAGGGGSTPSTSRPSTSATANLPSSPQALVVRGKVALQDGTTIHEPIAIERVCNGAVRREGYTDFKGNFEFDLGQSAEGRDASESGRDIIQNSGHPPTLGQDSDNGASTLATSKPSDSTHPELMGCELRAALPGFRTSSVMIRPDGSSWSLNVGTIVLARMEGVTGSTVSLTTMNAPPGARQAYEKGEKDFDRNKFSEAEKELKKAVT